MIWTVVILHGGSVALLLGGYTACRRSIAFRQRFAGNAKRQADLGFVEKPPGA